MIPAAQNHRVLVKICGVTDAADARLCAELGVDMIGLNFSPESKRCISAADAREIIDTVRPVFPTVKFVGVFVNQPVDITHDLRLDAVQLHGEESPEFVRNVAAPFVIKALRVGEDFAPAIAERYDCDAILLDSYTTDARGGTGETFDWSAAISLKPHVKRLILAGGLTSANVRQAIEVVTPYAVDVCSGVEDAARRKSADKLRQFITEVRRSASAVTRPQ